MIYAYNKTTKEVEAVTLPKLKGDDAKRIEKAQAPTDFLKNVMSMELKTAQV